MHLCSGLVALVAAAVLAAGAGAAPPPNVLFIVIDDLGFDDVGFRSHQINTPTIDRLAAEGMVLNQYYSQDVCSPARASIMTGRYAMHHSIVDWIPPQSSYGLPLDEVTMAQKMKERGYATHAVGKWHLGFYKWEMTPTFRGFDSFYGFYSGGEDYFKHVSDGAYDFRRDPTPRCGKGCSQPAWEAAGNYSTTLFSEEAVRIVEQHDTSKPLFMYLAYQAVHAPAEVPDAYVQPYVGKIADTQRRTFAGMLSCADEGIGNVTAALKARGMDENLLIVVVADNGGPLRQTGDGIGARNWPLRGGKHSIFEGGVRVTGMLWGSMLQGHGGSEYQNLMHAADWLPTLGEAVGVPLNGTKPLDGVSHWSNLQQGGGPQVRSEVVIGNSTDSCGEHCGFGLRVDNWKFMRGGGGIPNTWEPPVNTSRLDENLSQCNISDSVCYPGDDIRSFNCSDAGACCLACQQERGCTLFTFNKHGNRTGVPICYLKRVAKGPGESSPDCISGVPGGPLPPGPANSNLLFDVMADPTEHNETSAAYPALVAQMQSRLNTILQSYTQAANDPNCPFKKWPQGPNGAYMEPWC